MLSFSKTVNITPLASATGIIVFWFLKKKVLLQTHNPAGTFGQLWLNRYKFLVIFLSLEASYQFELNLMLKD